MLMLVNESTGRPFLWGTAASGDGGAGGYFCGGGAAPGVPVGRRGVGRKSGGRGTGGWRTRRFLFFGWCAGRRRMRRRWRTCCGVRRRMGRAEALRERHGEAVPACGAVCTDVF